MTHPNLTEMRGPPVEFDLNGQRWRLCYFAQTDNPDGAVVLACTMVPVVDGRPVMPGPRGMSDELTTMATVVADIVASFSCCDKHAEERAHEVAQGIVQSVRERRAFNAARPAGKPN